MKTMTNQLFSKDNPLSSLTQEELEYLCLLIKEEVKYIKQSTNPNPIDKFDLTPISRAIMGRSFIPPKEELSLWSFPRIPL